MSFETRVSFMFHSAEANVKLISAIMDNSNMIFFNEPPNVIVHLVFNIRFQFNPNDCHLWVLLFLKAKRFLPDALSLKVSAMADAEGYVQGGMQRYAG